MSVQQAIKPHVGFIFHQLENGFKTTDPVVLEKFVWCHGVMSDFSGWDQHYFTCLESPDKIIQLSGWDSVEAHYIDLHSSPVCRDLLDEFGGILDVKASWHADIAYKTLSKHAQYLALARLWVPKAAKAGFEADLHKWVPSLASRCSGKLSHGWRLAGGWADQEHENDLAKYSPEHSSREDIDPEELEEWDIVLPFDNTADWKNDLGLLKSTGSLQYLLRHVNRLEVKHLEAMKFDV